MSSHKDERIFLNGIIWHQRRMKGIVKELKEIKCYTSKEKYEKVLLISKKDLLRRIG